MPHTLPLPESLRSQRRAQVKPVVGMIHVGALPGTPRHRSDAGGDRRRGGLRGSAAVSGSGVNCLMHRKHARRALPARHGRAGDRRGNDDGCAGRPRTDADLPIGLQILAGADIEAMAVAHAAGLDFIRTECFCFAHVADEGIMESNAAKLLRYRRMHRRDRRCRCGRTSRRNMRRTRWTADLTLGDMAEAAEFMGAETIIVTGPAPDAPAAAGGRRGSARALRVAGVRGFGRRAGESGGAADGGPMG